MVILNMVMKFNNFQIVYNFSKTFLTCRLHLPAAWKALRQDIISNEIRSVLKEFYVILSPSHLNRLLFEQFIFQTSIVKHLELESL